MRQLSLDTRSIAHPQRRSVSSIMLHVVIALIPGITLYALLIDQRLITNLLIAIACALVFESVLVKLRKRSALIAIKDASVALAAILLVLSVPQGLPVWQLVLGVFILCTLGKHIFGGLGHNPFNPAMVAYAVLIVSFPMSMTQWSSDNGILETPADVPSESVPSQGRHWDSVTGATPLDRLDTAQRMAQGPASNAADNTDNTDNTTDRSALSATTDALITPSELVLQSDWFWLSLTWLLGGIYLLLMRIISWRIPVSVLTTLWCLYALYGVTSPIPVLPPTVALFSGAIMLGAFFIATDPVSAATSNPGKLLYGAGIGVFCFFIREFSAYPEGVAFAVLLMNMCVPLIDHAFTRNRLSENRRRNSDDGMPPS